VTTRLVDTTTTTMLMKSVLSGRLKPKELITHRFKLADVMEAYDAFADAVKHRALKVMLTNAGAAKPSA